MKKGDLWLLMALLCMSIGRVMAQAPQLINYQAVVRGSSGNPVPGGTSVSLRFTIHDLIPTGTPVFMETDNDTANQFGLVGTRIGGSGNLAVVNWGSGAKYLQVEADINNVGTFSDMGTSQLLSVPYALFAANSAVGPQGPTGDKGSTGFTGPTGPTGNGGATGATGATGANGTNGSNGVTGATGPSGQDGTNGLNGATGAIGSNGTNGINGATGATGPSGQDGINGTNGLNGVTGATGSNGANGTNGATGANGTNGSNGVTGATGPSGQDGTNGINGLNGATGATGSNGTNGNNGATGATGPSGQDGTNGTNGLNGVTGATGTNGSNGVTGATGPSGQDGTNGATGATGPSGQDGTNGTNGLNGAIGATGSNGTNGINGATGATGPSGQDGNNGTNGLNGATGANGTNGSNGVTGATGPSGQDGTNGINGLNGAIGATGSNGTNGNNGATGATGPSGQDGTNGTNGLNGATGANGTNGSNGVTGATGPSGQDGTNGTNGLNGVTGATGSNGTNGTNGVTGVTGPSGQDGANGTNGLNGVTGATGATGPSGSDGTNGSNGVTGATGQSGNDGTNGTNGLNGATGATGSNGTNGAAGATGATGATGPSGPTVLTVSNTSAGNTISTTVNSITGTPVSIINSDSLVISGDSITAIINGVASTPVSLSSSNWALKGNTGTTPGTNFVGTTDANDLVFKTDNSENMRIHAPNGELGLGTQTPGSYADYAARIDIVDTTGGNRSDIEQLVVGNGGYGAHVFAVESGTLSAPTAATSGQTIGDLDGDIYTGAGYNQVAQILFTADGTVSGSSSPGRIDFATTPQGSTNCVTCISNNIRMTIKNNGYIGIGTTNPGYPLDVATGSGQWANAIDIIPTTFAGSKRASMRMDDWLIEQDLSGGGHRDFSIYQFSTNEQRLVIDTTGNVGIGTNNAAIPYTLTVRGTTSTTNFQMTNGATNGYVLQSDAAGNGSWVNLSALTVVGGTGLSYSHDTLNSVWTQSGNNIHNNNNGNIGIGTTTPTSTLDVHGNVNLNFDTLYFGPSNSASAYIQYDGGENMYINASSNGHLSADPGTSQVDILVWNYNRWVSINNKLGIGVGSSIINTLDANGAIAVGTAYAGISAAPSNGAIIQGNVGIGTSTPASTLEVNGTFATTVQTGQVAGTNNPDNTAAVWIYSSGAGSITLPAAGTCSGRRYVILNQTGASVTTSSYIDITTASVTSLANNTSIEVISDGTNWRQIK